MIIDVKVFSRNEDDPLTSRDKELEREKAKQYEKREIAKVLASRDEQLAEVLIGSTVESLKEKKKGARNLFKPGTKLKAKDLEGVDLSTIDWDEAGAQGAAAPTTHLKEIVSAAKEKIATIREKTKERIEKITQRDDLPPGVVQLVKVYVAQKRRSLGRRQDGRPPRQQGRSSRGSSPRRTCRSCPTGLRSRSSSTRWACPAA